MLGCGFSRCLYIFYYTSAITHRHHTRFRYGLVYRVFQDVPVNSKYFYRNPQIKLRPVMISVPAVTKPRISENSFPYVAKPLDATSIAFDRSFVPTLNLFAFLFDSMCQIEPRLLYNFYSSYRVLAYDFSQEWTISSPHII